MFLADIEMKLLTHASSDHFIPSYHDRHQAARNSLYHSERQEQRREPTYWTLPGSRVASQDYATWMEQEPVSLSSLHFPFILDRHPQHHQDVGAYQPLEARDREWAQRASREYERGFPREGWPRRWETCSPARYGRDVSAKRNDSSYRELEAWAARYSHSLQRRRRIEAELRGASSQGPAESGRAPERDIRGGTTTLQQVVHPGLCDRAGRQQPHPLQAAHADTGPPPREKTCYQRRTFSQPPGYIAPPPYDTPQKSSSASHQGDTSWEQESKKQTHWSHPILKKQDVALDHRMRKTEGCTKAEADQHNFCSQYSKAEADVPRPHVQFEVGLLSLQQPPALPAFPNKAEEPSSKIIEGRKFKLNKKAGGLTIFCLVSRIADAAEAPSPPVGPPQMNAEGGEAAEGASESDISWPQKLADEVDYRVPALPVSQAEPSNAADGSTPREGATGSNTEKPETDEEERAKDADSPAGMQSGKPAPVRYPLWREPSFPVRSEHVSSPTDLRAKSWGGESEEVEAEAEGAEGVLRADPTCVVAKMEQIPSPKKAHVCYFEAAPHLGQSEDIQEPSSQECVQSNRQPNQGGDAAQNTNLELLLNTEKPEMEPDSDNLDKVEPEQRTISDPDTSSSVYDRETLAVRAERILGIPLTESVAEQLPEDAASLKTKAEQSLPAQVHDAEALAEDKTEQEHPRNQLELDQSWISSETVEAKDQADDKGGQDSGESEEEASTTETHFEASHENVDHETKADSDDKANERSEKEGSRVEDNASSPLLSPSTDFRPPPSLDCQSPDVLPPAVPSTANPASISDDPESEGTDPDPMAPITAPENASPAPASSQQLASPPPQDPQSTTSHESETQSQLVSSVLDLGEDGTPSQLTNIEMSEEFEDISKDETEELVPRQQDEVREEAEANGGLEINLDNEQRAEKEEAVADSGVEEAESPAEVSQKAFQGEDNVYTEESPRSPEQLCEETEEEHTDQIQELEEPNTVHACLQPAGTNTNNVEPLSEVEAGLLEEKTSHENSNQLIQSQEITTSQLCDTDNASVTKETSGEPSEGDAGDPASLPKQEMGKENSPENHTDTESQLELSPSSSPPPSPPDIELHPTSELPAPSQVPPRSDTEVVPLVKMDDPEAAATTETDMSPLHLGSCEESQKLSSSPEPLPGLPRSSSPPPLLEGGESAALDWPLSEEPQYPQSLWDAVNRIRKHTAPDSENEEEELGEAWDPENTAEDSGRPRGAQDKTAETKEVLADESVKDADAEQSQQDAGELEEGPMPSSSSSSHSSGEVATDEEERNEDTSCETGTEVRALKDEELQTAAGEQSCLAEDEDEDQGHQ